MSETETIEAWEVPAVGDHVMLHVVPGWLLVGRVTHSSGRAIRLEDAVYLDGVERGAATDILRAGSPEEARKTISRWHGIPSQVIRVAAIGWWAVLQIPTVSLSRSDAVTALQGAR